MSGESATSEFPTLPQVYIRQVFVLDRQCSPWQLPICLRAGSMKENVITSKKKPATSERKSKSSNPELHNSINRNPSVQKGVGRWASVSLPFCPPSDVLSLHRSTNNIHAYMVSLYMIEIPSAGLGRRQLNVRLLSYRK